MAKYKLTEVGEELFGNWGWQTRMAEKLGVNISTIKRWLTGVTPVPPPVRLALQYLLMQKRHPRLNYKQFELDF